jgi:hypothetical protein
VVDPRMPPEFKGAALLNIYHQRKPAYYAFQTLVKKIEFFTEAKKLSTGTYKFIVKDQPVYILWAPGSLPEEISGRVKVTDLSGKESFLDTSQIILTDSPIFLEPMK